MQSLTENRSYEETGNPCTTLAVYARIALFGWAACAASSPCTNGRLPVPNTIYRMSEEIERRLKGLHSLMQTWSRRGTLCTAFDLERQESALRGSKGKNGADALGVRPRTTQLFEEQ